MILMSATLDEIGFTEYFSSLVGPRDTLVPAPFLYVAEKKAADVSIFYWDQFSNLLYNVSCDVTGRPVFAADKPALFDSCVVMCKLLIHKFDNFEMQENKNLGPGKKRKEPGMLRRTIEQW